MAPDERLTRIENLLQAETDKLREAQAATDEKLNIPRLSSSADARPEESRRSR